MFAQRPGNDAPFYAPSRDLAYCWRKLFVRSCDVLDAPIWGDWSKFHQDWSDEQRHAVVLGLVDFMTIANDPEADPSLENAWQVSGLDAAIETCPEASVLYFAAAGRLLVNACFIAARSESTLDIVQRDNAKGIQELFELAVAAVMLDSEPGWLKWCRRNLPPFLYSALSRKHRNKFFSIKRAHGEEKSRIKDSCSGVGIQPGPAGSASGGRA